MELDLAGHPAADIGVSVDWSALRSLRTSDTGAGGVLFVLSADGVRVVKAGASLGQEYIGTAIGARLGQSTPLRVPAMRLCFKGYNQHILAGIYVYL
jgi:hypothetical protein